MQSTVDIEAVYENSKLNLIACLALYQHRQDKAIGIDWISGRTKGLLLYYNHLQEKQLSKLLQASYLNGIIQQGASEIKMLVARAKKAKNKQRILERVQALEKIVKDASNELEKIKQ